MEALTLLRSNGKTVTCSEMENADLFHATLGGLGLTGVIMAAAIKLRPVSSSVLENENVRCDSLAEALALFAEPAADWEYRFFWFDPFDPAGRGVFTRARHSAAPAGMAELPSRLMRVIGRVPLPAALGTPALWRAWYAFLLPRMPRRRVQCMSYRHALAPLGELPYWNRMLGRRGLLHFQCVFPQQEAPTFLATLLAECRNRGELPCLASIKLFGQHRPAGLLSFPREGITVALDFSHRGESTRRLLRELETRVLEAGGAIYPGKDSTLSREGFRRSFPAWESFARQVDPRFSSSFWRRVCG